MNECLLSEPLTYDWGCNVVIFVLVVSSPKGNYLGKDRSEIPFTTEKKENLQSRKHENKSIERPGAKKIVKRCMHEVGSLVPLSSLSWNMDEW